MDIVYLGFTLLSSPLWCWRLVRTGKWRTDWRGRFGHADIVVPVDGVRTVLIHAVSVGEVNAIRDLVAELHRRHGDAVRLVISTTTDTGTERARALFADRHAVVRYPLDFSWMVRRFLNRVRPDAVILVELEVWPNFVNTCTRRAIPVAVINGRLSERSFGRYRKVRGLMHRAFSSIRVAAVQDDAYATRFSGMGVPRDRVRVTGSMKWDTAKIADAVEGSDALAQAMGIDRSRPLVVCGSTGPDEEKQIAQALTSLKVQLMFAPRKPERFNEAAQALGSDVIRRTQHSDGTRRLTGGDLFLLDTLGELRRAYALADVAIVGRSFCPLFGSDMTEPIALGKPTIIGPNTSDFADMMDRLRAGDGIVQVEINHLADAVRALLKTDRGAALAAQGREVIRSQQGATVRHADLIDALLQEVN